MSNITKLKSCPFCGGEAKLLIVGKRADGGEEWYVGCENLHCSLHPHSTVPYASAEIAAEAWNKRTKTTGSAPVGDKAAIREALEGIVNNLENRLFGRYSCSATDEWMLQKARAALVATPEPVGNAAKMSEALEYLRDVSREFYHLILNSKHNEICDKYKYPEVAKIRDAIANAGLVLAAPPRNCEVGTAEEQNLRHSEWCHKHGIDGDGDVNCASPDMHCHLCFAKWAQLPYEEGGAK